VQSAVNPAQQRALAILADRRDGLTRDFPNRWVAIDADARVRDAETFDILADDIGQDAGRCVFAFLAVGAWA
jgi:hypothetical protein